LKNQSWGLGLDRAELDSVVEASLVKTLRDLGQESLESALSLIQRGNETNPKNLMSRLGEIDSVLDELFTKFSILIKHVVILEACSRLKLEPPRLGKSLFWMVEELHSSLWGVRT
jgi:hypothetical protein